MVFLKISLITEKLGFWHLPAFLQRAGPLPSWPGASLMQGQAKNSSQAAAGTHRSLWPQLYFPKSREAGGEETTECKGNRIGSQLVFSTSSRSLAFFPTTPCPLHSRRKEVWEGEKGRKTVERWRRLGSEAPPPPTPTPESYSLDSTIVTKQPLVIYFSPQDYHGLE